MKPKPTTRKEYLAALPQAQKKALAAVRAAILSVAPGLEERLSSGAPFFWYRDRRAVGYGAANQHLSFYIMHGRVLATHEGELAGYDTSRTVVRFTAQKPLPATLIRKLVRARLAEIAGRHSRP